MQQRKDRQNYYFIVVNKTGGLQYFVQFKEIYREGQELIGSNAALSAASTFYAIDNMTQTIIPEAITAIESEKDSEFERANSIDIFVTQHYIASQFLTMTGFRFITLSSIPQGSNGNDREIQKRHEDNLRNMRQIYRLYTDYFSKDPFQSEDQPLSERKRQQFEREVRDILDY